MNGYFSVEGETHSEIVIEKSRFISYLAHTEGEGQAKAFLQDVRTRHPLATHVCYGYIADKIGNMARFSDDGEPQGTAGMPILNVLKAQKVSEVSLAVVRYFGGIKLGAGGLTRAYSGSASKCLQSAQIKQYEPCVEIRLETDYSNINAAMRFLSGYEILSRDFSDKARFVVAVKEEKEENFSKEVTDFLNGKIFLTSGKRYFKAFPLNA